MKHATIIFAVAMLLMAAACSGKSASTHGDFAIATTFAPSPPKEGLEALTIALKDPSGTPVEGARVTIDTAMPAMSMTGPSAIATDDGDGTYSARIGLQFATTWVFTITAASKGRSARSVVTVTVGNK